jgi:hypothetical protein
MSQPRLGKASAWQAALARDLSRGTVLVKVAAEATLPCELQYRDPSMAGLP